MVAKVGEVARVVFGKGRLEGNGGVESNVAGGENWKKWKKRGEPFLLKNVCNGRGSWKGQLVGDLVR